MTQPLPPRILMLGLLLVTLHGVAGCSTDASTPYRELHPPVQDNEMVQWSGRPAAVLVKEWGRPTSIKQLEERRLEYRYPRSDISPSCVHFWIMNEQNFVVGHRYEGECRP
jgi:hypothetical protein